MFKLIVIGYLLSSRIVLCIQVFFILRVLGDIQRGDGGFYNAEFSVVKDGRIMEGVLMHVEQIDVRGCMIECVQHRRCKTINYNYNMELCELVDRNFEEGDEVVTTNEWVNFGTPDKGKVHSRTAIKFISSYCSI